MQTQDNEQFNEQLPVKVVSKLLGGQDVRVVIAEHPVTKELAPCVPYLDYARAFSYDEPSIFKMIQRSGWLKRYSSSSIMEVEGVGFRPHLCIFEESMLGIFMKLQPKRCKDPDVAAKVDKLQEELILILRDTLRGFNKGNNSGYKSPDGRLPSPGMSMDGISRLCRDIDKTLKGKAALRALNYFTGMPVDDLIEEIEDLMPRRIENDWISGFIDECCVLDPLLQTSATELYEAYAKWFNDKTGNQAQTQKVFGREMRKRFVRRKSGIYKYVGVGLR